MSNVECPIYKYDGRVISQEKPFSSFRLSETCSGESRESEASIYDYLRALWIPVFTGMTIFYGTVKQEEEN